ncbi:MAG: hypothetical protein WC813_01825 [Patescibacteria group bacterium]|jgi:hypothetical protein
MESKSHFLVHFIPGMLLGSVVGLAFGSLLVASQIPRVVVPASECAGSFKDLSWKPIDEHNFGIYLKNMKVAEVDFPDGLFNPGNFYQVNPDSNNAYLDFNPDGLGGYILYPVTYDMIRVNTCTGKVDRLLDSTFGQGGIRQGLDISPNEKYLAEFFQDIGPITSLRIVSTDNVNITSDYSLPDQKYTQFDAKFSKDGTQVIVIAALGDAEHEKGIRWVFDMATRSFIGQGELTETNKWCPTNYWTLFINKNGNVGVAPANDLSSALCGGGPTGGR